MNKEKYNSRIENHFCTRSNCNKAAIANRTMCQDHLDEHINRSSAYRKKYPEKTAERRRESMKKWSKENPEEKIHRNKKWRDKWSGVSESAFREKLSLEFPAAVSMDDNRPDFYDPTNKYFIEIKRALPFRKCMWIHESPEFPGLFFAKRAKGVHTPTIDEQIVRYPKPLLVIVVHALTGNEIIRKIYYDKNNEPYPYYPIKIIPKISLTETCPVCKGRGQVEQYSDLLPGTVIPSTTIPIPRMIICNRCGGSGRIEVNKVDYPKYPDPFPIFPSYPPSYPSYPPYYPCPAPIWCNVSRGI